jgi:hypothetical protein
MADLASQAQAAVDTLAAKTDDELYVELGKRLAMNRTDPKKVAEFQPQIPPEFETLGMVADLKALGRNYFSRVNKGAYELMCGSDADDTRERKKLVEAFGIGKEAVAAALAALLVAYLGIAPALAAVVAALVLRLFFRPAYDATCDLWKSKLPASPA